MTEHERIFELIPLHALDALEAEERREVEEHLETCDECAVELSRHRSVAGLLVPDSDPSPVVWDRIAAEIGDPRQLTDVVSLDERRSARPSSRVWQAVAAVAAVIGVAVLFQLVTNDVSGPAAVVAAAEEAAEESGTIVTEFTADDGTIARVILTPDGEGFVLPDELDPLDDDRTYQLWVVTPDELVISAGVLGSQPAPSRFTWAGEVAGFVLTREVAGGVVSSEGDVVAVSEI